jgi:DNA-binding transcriptional ArsR family regulator
MYNNEKLQQVHELFAIVAKKRNAEVLEYLNKEGEKTVTELFIHFRFDQSRMSNLLRPLRVHNFVNRRREGKNVYYSINMERMRSFSVLVDSVYDRIN